MVNHFPGCVTIVLAIPLIMAGIAFVHAGAGWPHLVGSGAALTSLAFVAVVDGVRPVQFRSPVRQDAFMSDLAIPFWSIVLVRPPMFRLNRRLWFATVATKVLLLGAIGMVMRKDVARCIEFRLRPRNLWDILAMGSRRSAADCGRNRRKERHAKRSCCAEG